MSVFFAWCASFRKPPKLDQNGMETKDDDEEEGSEWTGEYESEEDDGDAVEMQERGDGATAPLPDDDAFVRKQSKVQAAISAADGEALKQLDSMSNVAAPFQDGVKADDSNEKDVTASPSDVSVHVDPSSSSPSLPASSAPPLVFIDAFYLPLPTNQFIALIILGCLASAICSGASSAAGSDSGFAISIVLAAPQFMSLLTTTALMPPLLLRIMCIFHVFSIFFSGISVVAYGMSATVVGPSAAASPTIACLLWFVAAVATFWCSCLSIKHHIHMRKHSKPSKVVPSLAAEPSSTSAPPPSPSSRSPRAPPPASALQSFLASVSRCFACMLQFCSCSLWSLLVVAALLWLFVQIACTYHASNMAHGQVADAAPGDLFDIGGGVKMHMMCQGKASNETAATVVFESMEAVGQALAWSAVMEAMPNDVRVCAYDRRGYGWSSLLPYTNSDSQVRGVKEITLELKLLLKASAEQPPFVLVGHSVGAMYMRMFAAENPTQVAAVLSIDGALTDTQYWDAARPALTKLSLSDLKLCRMLLAPLGIIDLVASQVLTRVMDAYLGKQQPSRDQFLRRFVQPGYCLTVGVEIGMFQQAVETVRSASDSSRQGGIHLLVLRSNSVSGVASNEKIPKTNKSWKEMQMDLLQSATKIFPLVEGSSVCSVQPCRQSYTIEYKIDASAKQNTTRYSSGQFLRPNTCSSHIGFLAPVLENEIFSTSPFQSFHVGADAVKGSWFVGVPKRVTVNGAFCYEAWANRTYYQEQGNYNALAQYADEGACPQCGTRVANASAAPVGVCNAAGAVSCSALTRGFNYRCEAWKVGAVANTTGDGADMFSGTWQGHCDQASGVMIATPLNSLSKRMGVAVGGTEAMTFNKPDIISYAVRYAVSLGLGKLPNGNSSNLVDWVLV